MCLYIVIPPALFSLPDTKINEKKGKAAFVDTDYPITEHRT